jgi:hypothetical protein
VQLAPVRGTTMVASKPSGSGARDRFEVDERNMIRVSFGDMAEEDQRRIKEEMRRESWRRSKLRR